MRLDIVIIVALMAGAAGCSKPADQRTYRLQGQVLSLDAPRKLTIKHEEIKGFMPAMTMPYEVKDEKLLTGLAAGDLINATLVVVSNDAYLATIKKVGQAPLEKPRAQTTTAPAASSGFELLKPGEPVPMGAFLDQDGRKRSFESFKGSPVVLTFIYTRCPLPTFCPLMDRHFVTIQNTLKEEAALRSVHLVTVSFDPSYDTPPVLKKHARILKADLSRWTFLTGDRDEVDKFAMRFGVSIARSMNDPRDITHNLRTAIIDADGRLVKVYTGNDWTPEQVLTDLTPVVRAN
jgi:protein SCO1